MKNSFLVFWASIIVSLFFFFMFLFRGWPFLFFLFLPPIFWGFSKKDEINEEHVYSVDDSDKFNYCPNCGYQLVGFERFCPICGYRLKE